MRQSRTDAHPVQNGRSAVTGRPPFHNNSAATLEAVVDHDAEFFKFVEASSPPGVVPPVASTDGAHFNRKFLPDERPPLLAYLRKL